MAFLLATIDDSTRIITICLEKARNRSNCTIRLTSNIDNLDEVMYGFKLIARILERVALRDLIYYID